MYVNSSCCVVMEYQADRVKYEVGRAWIRCETEK